MSLPLIHNEPPDLVLPKMLCDEKLHPKLDLNPLTSHMNRTHAALLIGSPGSGKTTLMEAFLRSKSMYYQTFDEIYCFMPPGSRQSIKNSCLKYIRNQDHIYDELTEENLNDCFDRVAENRQENLNSLVIFDDMQQFLKDSGVCRRLTNMIANRRNQYCTIWILLQNYIKCPKPIRLLCTDLFCFRLSKAQTDKIFEELIEIKEPVFQKILNDYTAEWKNNKLAKSFLYINVPTQSFFLNWDQIDLAKIQAAT